MSPPRFTAASRLYAESYKALGHFLCLQLTGEMESGREGCEGAVRGRGQEETVFSLLLSPALKARLALG